MRPSILVTEVMTVTVGASDSWKPAVRPVTHGFRPGPARPPRLLRSFVPYCTRKRSVVRDKGA